MEINLTKQEKSERFWLELKDMLFGAAYPFMLMCILSVSIIAFATTDDVVLNIIVVCIGEALLWLTYVIFGRQSGITAYKRTVSGEKKRTLSSEDRKAYYKTGEYAPYKGFIIGFISTVPYIIFQVLYFIFPIQFFSFVLQYAFGWAVLPFSLINGVPHIVNFVSIIPAIAIQGAAYLWGKKKEEKRAISFNSEKDKKGKGKK